SLSRAFANLARRAAWEEATRATHWSPGSGGRGAGNARLGKGGGWGRPRSASRSVRISTRPARDPAVTRKSSAGNSRGRRRRGCPTPCASVPVVLFEDAVGVDATEPHGAHPGPTRAASGRPDP